jgi:hypothetical protein
MERLASRLAIELLAVVPDWAEVEVVVVVPADEPAGQLALPLLPDWRLPL